MSDSELRAVERAWMLDPTNREAQHALWRAQRRHGVRPDDVEPGTISPAWEPANDDFNDRIADWSNAFKEAMLDIRPAHPGAKVDARTSLDRFRLDDVRAVLAKKAGANDERPWLAAVELWDGRWAFVEASCDYTGWDCQASGSATVAATREELQAIGMSEHARATLGLAKTDGTEPLIAKDVR